MVLTSHKSVADVVEFAHTRLPVELSVVFPLFNTSESGMSRDLGFFLLSLVTVQQRKTAGW